MKHGHPNAAWSNLISPGLKLANCADFVTWMWGYYMSKDANLSLAQLAANNELVNNTSTGLRAFNTIVNSNQGKTGTQHYGGQSA